MAEPWTDEEVALLRDCLVKGMSYGQMLPLFPGKARNALIGKAHRKGFHRLTVEAPPPPTPVATPAAPVQASFKGFKFQMLPDEPAPSRHAFPPAVDVAQPWPEVQKQATQPPAWAPPPLASAAPELPPIEPAGEGVLLLDLREQHCRWPLNDGGPFRFCGCRKAPKSPYCEYHHRLSLPKVSEKRKPYVPPKVSAYKFRTRG
jgi:hypothetical protein